MVTELDLHRYNIVLWQLQWLLLLEWFERFIWTIDVAQDHKISPLVANVIRLYWVVSVQVGGS